MIKIAKSPAAYSASNRTWHERLLEWLPAIHHQACIAFRFLDAELREELLQEVVASTLRAFLRLWRQGRGALAYVSPAARFIVGLIRQICCAA